MVGKLIELHKSDSRSFKHSISQNKRLKEFMFQFAQSFNFIIKEEYIFQNLCFFVMGRISFLS